MDQRNIVTVYWRAMSGKASWAGHFPRKPGLSFSMIARQCALQMLQWFSAQRLAELPDSFVPMAPDLAVEVLSPSDRMADALAKVAMYLQAGTPLVWLVNPATRTVVVFRSEMDPVTLGESDTLDGGDVLPGFSVPVAEIFA